jgi:hypothetical protein
MAVTLWNAELPRDRGGDVNIRARSDSALPRVFDA